MLKHYNKAKKLLVSIGKVESFLTNRNCEEAAVINAMYFRKMQELQHEYFKILREVSDKHRLPVSMEINQEKLTSVKKATEELLVDIDRYLKYLKSDYKLYEKNVRIHPVATVVSNNYEILELCIITNKSKVNKYSLVMYGKSFFHAANAWRCNFTIYKQEIKKGPSEEYLKIWLEKNPQKLQASEPEDLKNKRYVEKLQKLSKDREWRIAYLEWKYGDAISCKKDRPEFMTYSAKKALVELKRLKTKKHRFIRKGFYSVKVYRQKLEGKL